MAEIEKMTWDSDLDEKEAIEQQKENDFVLLPEGEYDFKIHKFEKDFYTAKPDAKIPSCPVANISLIIKNDEGETSYVHEKIFVHGGNKWQLLQFFTCLGLRKHGDGSTKMPWDQVAGATGRCKIGVRTYKHKDGSDRTVNTVKKWLDPVEEKTSDDDYDF